MLDSVLVVYCFSLQARAMKYTMTLHLKGLAPMEAAKVWYMRTVGKQQWSSIAAKVKTIAGNVPGSELVRVTLAGVATSKRHPAFALLQANSLEPRI